MNARVLWHGRAVLGGNLGAASSFVLRTENAYVFADGFEGGTTAGW